MKILLKKDIPDLGSKNEIKEVKPGYYYNYLSPQGLAMIVTEKKLKEIQEKEKAEIIKKKRRLKRAKQLVKQLKDKEFKIKKPATKKKLLYAQVKPEEIIKDLEEQSRVKKDLLRPEMVLLDPAIKKLGSFRVKVKLDRDQIVELKLRIVSKE